jgi:hypothetical protein
LRAHAGQPFAGFVPNQHATIAAKDECRDDEMLHQAYRKAVVPLRDDSPNYVLHLQRL